MRHIVVESPPKNEERPFPAWLKLLMRVLPAANPDFDSKIRDVHTWWIELDDHDKPQREIGFTESGQAVVAMPLGQNCGFWTDSQVTFTAGAYEHIEADVFERKWVDFKALR